MDYNQQGQLTNMAMNYGTDIVSQGGGMVQEKVCGINYTFIYYFDLI